MNAKSTRLDDPERLFALDAWQRVRRKLLITDAEFKLKYSERRRSSLRRGEPEDLADIFAGTIGGRPDPLPGSLIRARAELEPIFQGGTDIDSLVAIRGAFATIAALPVARYSTTAIMTATILLYQLTDYLEAEFGRVSGRGTPHQKPRRSEADKCLLAAAKLLRSKHGKWAVLRIAKYLADNPAWLDSPHDQIAGQGAKRNRVVPSVDAIRQRLVRMGFR